MAAERPNFVASLASLAPSGLVPAACGLILVDEGGAVIGAVGVTSDNDEACALAGVAASSLTARA